MSAIRSRPAALKLTRRRSSSGAEKMTSSERRRVEADYGGPADARVVIVKCAAGLLAVIAIAASGIISAGAEDPVRAALSVPRAVNGR
jgi:hypothetical protein